MKRCECLQPKLDSRNQVSDLEVIRLVTGLVKVLDQFKRPRAEVRPIVWLHLFKQPQRG